MTEKNFQRQVIKHLEETYDAYVVNQVAQAGYSKVGVPDLLVCINSQFIGIELKMGNGHKTSPLQQAHIDKIKKKGGIAFVLTWSNEWRQELLSTLTARGSIWVTHD